MTASTGQQIASPWRTLFLVAAAYDMLLGIAFFFLADAIFTAIGAPLPSHPAYVQLSALFVFIQGLSYWFVYRDPPANLPLVRIGIAYKAAYSGLTAYYFIVGQLPSVFFVPWAVVDFLFLIAFVRFIQLESRPA